jgi:GMP synthase (glutamine-hydrolysing)
MPAPRLLVIEGNSPQTIAEHVEFGGMSASDGYPALLRELLPRTHVDIRYPADLNPGPAARRRARSL